jgi:hypothetical protein
MNITDIKCKGNANVETEINLLYILYKDSIRSSYLK